MQRIKESLTRHICGEKYVFLFTGDKGSALLLNIAKEMKVNIVFINTGYHFDEIVDYVKSFGAKIEIIENNDATVNYSTDMHKCCSQRKVEALTKYLNNVGAKLLIVPFIDNEKACGIEDSYINGIGNIKIIRPLADFSERDIWVRIKKYGLTYSRIYNKGYRIVDCKPCTTRHGRKKQVEDAKDNRFDDETEEKLKALGYM